ncbi:hypothetical protein CEXT_747361 [Caerostris extrusa]|uniref:Uncharacterized protein n=1 Tax=Caerostris extrusa TaxID=172846 RepID=A0AAV4S2S3_CAEEX|nr:hypothetical protein CEXT_747361 [Caerostris extrusa]
MSLCESTISHNKEDGHRRVAQVNGFQSLEIPFRLMKKLGVKFLLKNVFVRIPPFLNNKKGWSPKELLQVNGFQSLEIPLRLMKGTRWCEENKIKGGKNDLKKSGNKESKERQEKNSHNNERKKSEEREDHKDDCCREREGDENKFLETFPTNHFYWITYTV